MKCLQAEDSSLYLKTDNPASAAPATGSPWRGYFLIAAATFCWGGAATVAKAMFQGTLFPGRPLVTPLVLTQARTTFAVLVLMPLLLWRRGPQVLRMPRRDLALCIVTGTLGMAGSNFFYYWAVQKTTVAVAITVQYTAPVWVLLFMVLRGRQKAVLAQAGAVVLAIAGIALTIGLFQPGIQLNAAGIAGALLASFSFAFYNIAGQGLVRRYSPLTVMCYALLGASIMWACVNPPARLVAQHYSSGQWMGLLVFACLATLVPYVFYFHGLKYLDPTRAVVTGCLEPVFAILFAMIFVGEGLEGLQAVGIAAVLGATVLAQRRTA